MLAMKIADTRQAAVQAVVPLMRMELMPHVEREHDFEDASYFYRFIEPVKRLRSVQTTYGEVLRHREAAMMAHVRAVCEKCRRGLSVEDRKYRFKTYEKCFVGEEAVGWMVQSKVAGSINEAVELGQVLLKRGFIRHLTKECDFVDDFKFYEFVPDAER